MEDISERRRVSSALRRARDSLEVVVEEVFAWEWGLGWVLEGEDEEEGSIEVG